VDRRALHSEYTKTIKKNTPSDSEVAFAQTFACASARSLRQHATLRAIAMQSSRQHARRFIVRKETPMKSMQLAFLAPRAACMIAMKMLAQRNVSMRAHTLRIGHLNDKKKFSTGWRFLTLSGRGRVQNRSNRFG
jgi:hypothetical protein